MTRLAAYIAERGNTLGTRRRQYTVDGISQDRDIAVATFLSKRARYSAVWCINSTVAGHPGAEVWSVISSSGREVDRFALLSNNEIRGIF